MRDRAPKVLTLQGLPEEGGDVSGHLSGGRDGVMQFLIGQAPDTRPILHVAGHIEADALVAVRPANERSAVQECLSQCAADVE